MVSHVLRTENLPTASTVSASERKKAVVCTSVGGALEFFDFASYAFFAGVISSQFFSTVDHTTALIASFAVFGVGFVSRPLGSVFFGRLADLKGRRFGLQIAMPLMGVCTLAIGLLPPYSAIGVAAPLVLILLRLLQGFSTGGESGNAIAYLIEWAPPDRRAFYTSFAHATSVGGTLLSSALAAILSGTLSHAALEAWGWRVPFLIGGLVIAPIGYYLRTKVGETPSFIEGLKDSETLLDSERRSHAVLDCARSIGFSSIWFVSYYVFMVYVPSFVVVHGHINRADALWITTAGFLMMALSAVIGGVLSDAVGRKPPLVVAALCFMLTAYPMFLLFRDTSSVLLVLLSILFCNGLIGMLAGCCTVAMAEMFPTRIRTTGVSVGYGLGVALFGGFASVISEVLVKTTGSALSPSFFVIATAALSLSVVLTLRETAHTPLVT
jgi:MFS transporter, MHS family, proline/betaine transporter